MAVLRFVELLAGSLVLSMLGQVAESWIVYEVCDKPADIIFLLDASSSVYGPDFKEQLKFAESAIGKLPVDLSAIRFGLITYSTVVRVEFGLRTYSTADETVKAISRVTQLRGNTRTDLALSRMRQMMAEDKRPGVPQIGILLTDGGSDKPAYTQKEAELAHREGIIMYAVGIGQMINHTELSLIASGKDFKHSVDDFDQLEIIRKILRKETCRTAGLPPTGCPRKIADVMFVVDGSGSIHPDHFKLQLKFLIETVGLFGVSETGLHVGVITFGDNAFPQFGLDRYYTVAEVQDAINGIVQQGGGTNTADALGYVRQISFTGGRPGALKIAVVITNGMSNEPDSTAKEAALLKEAGVTVFAIGVGSGVDKTELHAIASSPRNKHVYMVDDYDAKDKTEEQRLVWAACLNYPFY